MKTKLFIALALLSFSFLFAQLGVPYIEQAQTFLERGYCPQAEELMEKAIAQSPNNYDNYLVMFKVQMAKGDMPEAYKNLEYYVQNASGIDYDYYDNLLKLIEDSVIRMSKGIHLYQFGYFPGYLNSEFSDFAPIVTPDGNYLFFTSARKCQSLKENIFFSKKIGGTWGKLQPATTLLTNGNESLNSFSQDNEYAYLFGKYNGDAKSGIYRTQRVREAFTSPERLNTVSSDYSELQAYVFEDRVMFFTSNRPGSMGGYDIWVSENINGWQEPVNLGSVINTINDEQTPFISWDGQSLFFASNGHSSFGGFDIFKAKKSGNAWTEWETPINLGPEINTIYNERHYYRVNNSNEAFISSDRANGVGAEDIYKVVVLNEEYLDGIRISGEVTDNKGALVSADINWSYTYKDQKIVNVIQSNANGYYNLYLPKVDSVYFEIAKPNYQVYSNSILFEDGIKELNYDIQIELLEEKNYVIENIYFDFDKATLKEESFPSLDKLVATIMTNPGINVCIIGYTDDIGSAKYNQGLSERRAKSVYQYLINKGIDSEILNYRGEGQENPKVANDSEENRQLNRRVEFVVARPDQAMMKSTEMTEAEQAPIHEEKMVMPEVEKETEVVIVEEVEVLEETPEVTTEATDEVAEVVEVEEEVMNEDLAQDSEMEEESTEPFFTDSEQNIIKGRIARIAKDYQIESNIQVHLFNNNNRVEVKAISIEDGLKNDSFEQDVKQILNGWFIPAVKSSNDILEINPLDE